MSERVRLRDVGLELERARQRKGWSRPDLAARCGCSHGRIQDIEDADVHLRLLDFLQLAWLLDMDTGALLDRWGTPGDTNIPMPAGRFDGLGYVTWLARQFRRRRQTLLLRQLDVAGMCGRWRSDKIGQIEAGHLNLRLLEYLTLCRALGLSPSMLAAPWTPEAVYHGSPRYFASLRSSDGRAAPS